MCNDMYRQGRGSALFLVNRWIGGIWGNGSVSLTVCFCGFCCGDDSDVLCGCGWWAWDCVLLRGCVNRLISCSCMQVLCRLYSLERCL